MKYERRDRDFYATPEEPILKLLPYLDSESCISEPMCGDGAIVKVLRDNGFRVTHTSDIEPLGDMRDEADRLDVMYLDEWDIGDVDLFVSNPPWPLPPVQLVGHSPGYPTVPIIERLCHLRPTWLLLSADFMHNRYFTSLSRMCSHIVSVGRVKWIAGSSNTGFDNAAWYRFFYSVPHTTKFYPNQKV